MFNYILNKIFTDTSATTSTDHEDSSESEQTKEQSSQHPYDAYLVMDIEGTCEAGSDFDWPNEIIVSLCSVYLYLNAPSNRNCLSASSVGNRTTTSQMARKTSLR